MSLKGKNISLDELINDESFRAFVMKKSSEIEMKEWEEYLDGQNFDNDSIEKTKDIIRLLSNKKKKSPIYPKEAAKEALLKHINLEEKFQEDFVKKTTNKINWQWLKVAASVIVLIGITALVYYFVTTSAISKGNNIVLYTEIDVPAGEKTKITLADGTEVWINSESKLKYPNNYNINNRNIFLEGEAYFDVTHNKDLPFIVNTSKVKVQALGTQFDVKSYKGDKTFQTTVVSGSVLLENRDEDIKFAPVILKPDERATLSLNTSRLSVDNTKKQIPQKEINPTPLKVKKPQLVVAPTNTDIVISWKDHLLVFDNETLEELATKMSRWYKIHVEISDELLKNERYTGKFINNETIYQVLEAIKVTTPISYTKKGNKIFIYSSK